MNQVMERMTEMNKEEKAIISNLETYLITIASELKNISYELHERNKIEAEKE